MTNSKNTKRALLASVLSVVLCFAMLIGSTFAWFTDSVTSAGNKIQSGTLNIDLLVKKDGTYQSVKESKEAIFNYDKWEPGYTEVKNIKVTTTGNLALKYTLSIVPVDAVAAGDLAEVIDVYYAASEVTVDTRDLSGLTKLGTLKDVFDGAANTVINDTLIPVAKEGETANTEDFATIVLKMQEKAGNEYQNKSVGGGFDLNLVATQYTYENDSFDNQYDAGAEWPEDEPSTEEPEFPVPGPGEEEKVVSNLTDLNSAISNGSPANPDRIFIELNNAEPISTAIGNASVRYLTKTTVISSADSAEKVLSANDKTGAFRFGTQSFNEDGVSNLYLNNVAIEAMKHGDPSQNYTGIRLGSGGGTGLADKTINIVGGTFRTDCNEGKDESGNTYRTGAFVVYNSQNVTINFKNVNFEFGDWAALVQEYNTPDKTECANNTYNFINCTFTYVKADGNRETITINSYDDWKNTYLPNGTGSDVRSGIFRPTATSNSTFNFS